MTFPLLRRGGTLGVAAVCLIFSGCMRSPEAKSARYIENGKKLLQKNDVSRAALEFQNAVRATPRNPEAHYQLGQAYLASLDIPRAVASFRKALELNPKHAGAQLEIARLMSYSSNPDLLKEGQKRLQELLESSPENAQALHALALTEIKLGEPEDAMKMLTRAIASAPQEVMIAVTMAQTKLSQNDARGAEEVLKQACANAPKSADALVILGRFYESQMRTAEAEQQFRRAIALKPNDTGALINLGTLLYQSQRKPEAEQTFKRLSTLPDKNSKAIYGNFLFEVGRRDEAVREFEKLAKEDPEDRQLRTQLITAYRAVNRAPDAEKLLERALKKNPKDLDALLQRGETFLAHGKYVEAETDLNRVVSLQPNSAEVHYVLAKLHQAQGSPLRYREDLSKALQLNPYLLSVRLELAQALVDSKNAPTALNLVNEAPASQKTSIALIVERNWVLWATGSLPEMRKGIDLGLSQKRSTDLLLQDGIWKLRAKDFGGARASLEEALKINPGDLRALSALHGTYVAQKQAPTALQKVKDYSSRQPNSAPVQDFLGLVLLAHGERGPARAAFATAKKVDPYFLRADYSLVQLDFLDGKLDDASKRLSEMVAAHPDDSLARLWLGEVEAVRGNQNGALEHFRKVVSASPNNADGLNNLAYLLAEQNKETDQALKYAQRAEEISPDDPNFSDTLGWILYRKGLYPAAIQHLQRAAAKQENVVWKYHLAMAYAKAGDAAHARATLTAALKQNPNPPEAKAAREMIGILN